MSSYYKLTNQTKRKVLWDHNPLQLILKSRQNRFGSIVYDYAVTEKADGLRNLMYIGKDKIGYLINSKMNNIVNTGIEFIRGEWLLDGEYIQKNKNGEDIQLYIFLCILGRRYT